MHACTVDARSQGRRIKAVFWFFLVCMQPISYAKTNFFPNKLSTNNKDHVVNVDGSTDQKVVMLFSVADCCAFPQDQMQCGSLSANVFKLMHSCWSAWEKVEHKEGRRKTALCDSILMASFIFILTCMSRTQGRKEENSIMWFCTDGLLYFHSDLHE